MTEPEARLFAARLENVVKQLYDDHIAAAKQTLGNIIEDLLEMADRKEKAE